MVLLSMGEYMRRLARNLFLAVQMAVLLFVLMVTVATVGREYGKYRMVEGFSGSRGIMVEAPFYYGAAPDEIVSGMRGIRQVLTWGRASFMPLDELDEYKAVVYPDQAIDGYTPELQSGVWLDRADKNDGCLDIVISDNSLGWKTGDTFPLGYYDASAKRHEIPVRVIGMLEEGAEIVGRNFGSAGIYHYDYRDIYSTYRFEQEQRVLIMAEREEALAAGVGATYNQEYFIVYEDGISDGAVSANERRLRRNLGHGADGTEIVSDFEEYMGNSRHEWQRNLLMYVPVFLSLLVIAGVSLANVCMLNSLEDMHQNAVFSVLGLPWRKCAVIPLVQSLFTAVLAVLLCAVLVMLVYAAGLASYVNLDVSGAFFAWSAVLLAVLCLLQYAVPYILLRRHRPADALTLSRE